MKYVIAIGLVAVSLAACNKAPSHGGGGPPLRGGGAAALGPQRKPGLWEQSVQTERGRTIVSQACFDAASDRRVPILPRAPRRAGACANFNVAKSGDGYVVDTDCSFAGASGPRVTDQAVFGGDFSSKYTITNNVTVQNAANPARNGQHTLAFTATYKGDCPADIAPGQTKLARGDVIDTGQVRRGWGGTPMGVARPARNGAGQGGAVASGSIGGGQVAPADRWPANKGGRGASAGGGGDASDDDGGQ